MEWIIHTLQQFWRAKGCLILQPYDMPMGAGTFHPATAIRLLSEQHWKAAYVQGCRRPADGRYGENPLRLQHYYQFQVVMKPAINQAQEVYLASLAELGITRKANEIRFVDDNWKSPTMGAFGIGWEVWLNGMEISQFTYMTKLGGRELDPNALELTYGLERIAMDLQPKCEGNLFKVMWNEKHSYGDLFLANEKQGSRYNFEYADAEHLRTAFKNAGAKGLELAEEGDYITAWERCLEMSHCFNLLDAKAAFGATEREKLMRQVRELARAVADKVVAVSNADEPAKPQKETT